ncbi:MAG TPA: HAD-IC family P-type ATPase [Thermodesulfobacteriota bacterium]
MAKEMLYQEKNQVIAWHWISEQEVFKKTQSTIGGLNNDQVIERQEEFGKNVLPHKEPPTLGAIALHQFLSPLIYILLVAGIVSILIGEFTDALFIFVVILLNAGLGTYQEWKAEKSAAALHSLLKIFARARRGGVERQIQAEELVPGDIVLLESGNKVPADLRLIQVNNLTIDESLLTGESLAIEKRKGQLSEDSPVSERSNMAFAASTVTAGRGMGVVVATGIYTEVGKIAKTVTSLEMTKAPLVIRMERFAKKISFVVVGASALLAIIAIAKGIPYIEVFFMAVALAVSAIPEGLPVAMTVALSIAVNRMARRNVIVRKLTAVEGLGSCTYIASDKTGTLTVNQQTVKLIAFPSGERFKVSGEGYVGKGEVFADIGNGLADEARSELEEIAKVSTLCNEASLLRDNGQWKHHGDAIDVALLAFGYKLGIDPDSVRREVETVGEIPFESERRYAANFYGEEGRVKVAVKGAIEAILPFCQTIRVADRIEWINSKMIEKEALSLSENGYRVLAIASGQVKDGVELTTFEEKDIPPLTLLGLVGFIDPLRPEVKEAVEKCKRAGVEVAMVTGDHPATALAIARELGIAHSWEDIVSGHQLTEIGSPEVPDFLEMAKSVRVFARVTPMQKLDIVDALIKLGHFVAVTGDGVNDAPALRKANIGVAMGSATDVAKDTASIIVTDDNFASIVAGVEEGRFAYDNIRKVTYLLISTGAAEIVLFTLALLANLPLPLFAVQLLWLNLVTNGIQDVALAFEAGESGAMTRPPRKPAEGIFNKLMAQQTISSGATMGLVTFLAWYWLLESGWDEFTARNRVLLLMVLFENFHVFNCRSEYLSAFKVPLRRNVLLVVGVLAAQGIHVLAMYLPFMQKVLQVSPVSITEWFYLFLLGSTVLLAMEVFKILKDKKKK